MQHAALTIAKYIITYCNNIETSISNLKLQKLLYFAWIEYYKKTKLELFSDDICAWQLGPVVPAVYFEYCAFGGKDIRRQYETNIGKMEQFILRNFLYKYGSMTVGRLVNKSHVQDGAWDIVYDGGKGNHAIIPFDLIKEKECC